MLIASSRNGISRGLVNLRASKNLAHPKQIPLRRRQDVLETIPTESLHSGPIPGAQRARPCALWCTVQLVQIVQGICGIHTSQAAKQQQISDDPNCFRRLATIVRYLVNIVASVDLAF